jgi:hypothetical protein
LINVCGGLRLQIVTLKNEVHNKTDYHDKSNDIGFAVHFLAPTSRYRVTILAIKHGGGSSPKITLEMNSP